LLKLLLLLLLLLLRFQLVDLRLQISRYGWFFWNDTRPRIKGLRV